VETSEARKRHEEGQPKPFLICSGCRYVFQTIQDLVDSDNRWRRKTCEGFTPWSDSTVETQFFSCPECFKDFETYINV